MLMLLNNNIPYLWCAGNHDQNPNPIADNPNNPWVGNNYMAFNSTVMESKPYWVSDIYQGKNTAVQFSYGNLSFLVIDLEYIANSSAINWATNLITSHLNYNVIVATHGYINSIGGYGSFDIEQTWSLNFRDTLNKYSNVFMTLNGHDTSGDRTEIYASRNQEGNRTQIFFNRQDADSRQGADSVRIYTFNINNKMVNVSTYIVNNNTFLSSNDTANFFSFQFHTNSTV